MSSFFSGVLEEHHVIEANKQRCGISNEVFGLDDSDKLKDIIQNIKIVDRIENKRERIIRKISILIVSLGYDQPFKNGNKRTAPSIAILMLRLEHFDLPFNTKEQKKDVFNLLEGLMYKFEDYIPNLITDIENSS